MHRELTFNAPFNVSGAFSVTRTHPDAPNPGLLVEELGSIGLPLSIRDAEAIKQKAQSTGDDGCWVINGTQVRCIFVDTIAMFQLALAR